MLGGRDGGRKRKKKRLEDFCIVGFRSFLWGEGGCVLVFGVYLICVFVEVF